MIHFIKAPSKLLRSYKTTTVDHNLKSASEIDFLVLQPFLIRSECILKLFYLEVRCEGRELCHLEIKYFCKEHRRRMSAALK